MRRKIILLLSVVFLLYLGCFYKTDTHQIGIVYNMLTGEISLDDQPGWNVGMPWVLVSRIDIRPTKVCITSSSRSRNCKLVRFVPSAYKEFLALEGFRYYWLANRLSFNFGYEEEYRGMKDILRGYAFGVTPQPFVEVIQEVVP